MEVEWSLFASKQLDEVLDFVETEYGSMTAKRVAEKIDASVSRLLKFPESGILDRSLSDNQLVVRHLQLFPNILYYIVKDNFVIVVAIMHYRQSQKTITQAVNRALESYRS